MSEPEIDQTAQAGAAVRELMGIWRDTARPETMPRKDQQDYMTVAFATAHSAALEAAMAVLDTAAMIPDSAPQQENREAANHEALWTALETGYDTASAILTANIRTQAAQNRGPLDQEVHLKETLESAVMITQELKHAARRAKPQPQPAGT